MVVQPGQAFTGDFRIADHPAVRSKDRHPCLDDISDPLRRLLGVGGGLAFDHQTRQLGLVIELFMRLINGISVQCAVEQQVKQPGHGDNQGHEGEHQFPAEFHGVASIL